MDYNPPFHLFVSGQEGEASAHSGLLNEKLPCNRHNACDDAVAEITCGDWFEAVKTFLSDQNFRVIRKALPEGTVPERIDIRLEKHGRFYHPGRVEVFSSSREDLFAVNVAVHDEGLACLDEEHALLEKLANGSLPRVFGKGEVCLSNGHEVRLFLAEWLEGYSEFHLSDDRGTRRVVVWDRERGNFYLTPAQAFDLYRRASQILTSLYNPFTCEQVQPWHHAAGDFIVKTREDGVDVRLITVRQYTSFFEEVDDDPAFVVEALLLFFLNLSLRMRLDRIDGIGEIDFAGEEVVAATLLGFFDGLKQREGADISGIALGDLFPDYLKTLDAEELLESAAMVVGSWNPESPEIPVVKDNINDHIASILLSIEKYC